MDARMIVTLVVFLFMIVSFSLHKFPMALTAILGMLALVVTGCVEPKTALSNIGSSTVITMISMFIIAAGLGRTQMVEKLSKLVYRVSKGSFTKVLAGYVLVTFLLGQFIPSITALFALVCPLVIAMCEEHRERIEGPGLFGPRAHALSRRPRVPVPGAPGAAGGLRDQRLGPAGRV